MYADGDNLIYRFKDNDVSDETGHGTIEVGEIHNRYLFGDGVDQILADERVVSRIDTSYNTTLWAMTDHLGSVRDLVSYDAAENEITLEAHIKYDAFGNILSETDAGDDPVTDNDHIFGFTGRERDKESDLNYYRNRYYDPSTGRFLTADPIRDDFENSYRYVNNNPVSNTDPSGLEKRVFSQIIANRNGYKLNRKKDRAQNFKRFQQLVSVPLRSFSDSFDAWGKYFRENNSQYSVINRIQYKAGYRLSLFAGGIDAVNDIVTGTTEVFILPEVAAEGVVGTYQVAAFAYHKPAEFWNNATHSLKAYAAQVAKDPRAQGKLGTEVVLTVVVPASKAGQFSKIPGQFKAMAKNLAAKTKKRVVISVEAVRRGHQKTTQVVRQVFESLGPTNPKYRRGSINIFPESTNKNKPLMRKNEVAILPSGIRAYIRDIELQTGRKLHPKQIELLKEDLRKNRYQKLSTTEGKRHRWKFGNIKG